MKKKTLIPLFVMLLLFSALVIGQDRQGEQALKTFKPIVNKFFKFFSTNPKLILKSSFPDSPSGFVYGIREYSFVDASYNVEKTNSIVSPLIGYFEIAVTARDNWSCGNVKTQTGIYGWDKMEDALNNDNEKCFSSVDPNSNFFTYTIKFEFAYQNDKWILKDVNPKLILHPSTEPSGLAYNQKWIDLIQRGVDD